MISSNRFLFILCLLISASVLWSADGLKFATIKGISIGDRLTDLMKRDPLWKLSDKSITAVVKEKPVNQFDPAELYISQDVRLNRPLIVVIGDTPDVATAKARIILVRYLNYDTMEIKKFDLFSSVVEQWGRPHFSNMKDAEEYFIWFNSPLPLMAEVRFGATDFGKCMQLTITKGLPENEVLPSSAEKAKDLLK